MKKFMQILLASFGILALAFVGCNTAEEEVMEEEVVEEVVVEEVVEETTEEVVEEAMEEEVADDAMEVEEDAE